MPPLSKLFDRMDQNQDIFSKIMDGKDFAEVVKAWMLRKVYDRLTKTVINYRTYAVPTNHWWATLSLLLLPTLGCSVICAFLSNKHAS
ncbi:MAG: hypothetical protein ACP5IL_01315 [Syntrophobacteraceae bacterium]